jgi:hypothetical protein
MTGWYLLDSGEERLILTDAQEEISQDGTGVPRCFNASGKESLGFGGEKKLAVVFSVEQGLDAKPVANCEEFVFLFIEQNEGKFSAQYMHACLAHLLIKVNDNLTVRFCRETMPALLEAFPNLLETVELTIHDHDYSSIFVQDRL